MEDTKIQSRINELVTQRQQLETAMQQIQQQFEQMRTQLIAVNGAIEALTTLFSEGDVKDDTESKTDTRSDTNKG